MAAWDGVVERAIPKADTTSLADIAVQRRDLTERARSGKLNLVDLAEGTFTITNLACTALMHSMPSCDAAGLPFSRLAESGIACGTRGMVSLDCLMLTMTLSSDHRGGWRPGRASGGSRSKL
jgi:pyruvate dehydrogenase E2 component (dihydrolipoamide acetyltransferase)